MVLSTLNSYLTGNTKKFPSNFNKIIGYTGEGGKEIWNKPIFTEIPNGNILKFVDIILKNLKIKSTNKKSSLQRKKFFTQELVEDFVIKEISPSRTEIKIASNTKTVSEVKKSFRNVDISNRLLVEGDASFQSIVDISLSL